MTEKMACFHQITGFVEMSEAVKLSIVSLVYWTCTLVTQSLTAVHLDSPLPLRDSDLMCT